MRRKTRFRTRRQARRRTQRGGNTNTLSVSSPSERWQRRAQGHNTSFAITYRGRNINSIKNSKEAYSATRAEPQISLRLPADKMYMLVMFDPDAPAPGFLHWFFANIENCIPYKPAFAYYPPEPPSGIHCYEFRLYEQPTRLVENLPTAAGPFDLESFVKTKGLKIVTNKFLLVSRPK